LDVAAVRALRRELAVEKVITRAQRIKAYPKSAAGHRTVPAPAHVLERLGPFWQAAKDGPEPADGVRLLFRSPRDGRPLGYMAWWSAWQNAHKRLAARKAEVPNYSPHALRHTAASWWVQQGVPIFEVKELLGHSKIDSTLVYSHLAPGVHRSVREAWEALLAERSQRGVR
ncbi:MAG TPA: tyrosine-type recombinase/integrase, partial [Streptosporangiaceae bacterium]